MDKKIINKFIEFLNIKEHFKFSRENFCLLPPEDTLEGFADKYLKNILVAYDFNDENMLNGSYALVQGSLTTGKNYLRVFQIKEGVNCEIFTMEINQFFIGNIK